MKLPQSAEYALRAMAYLATQANGEPMTSKELAEATAIPWQFLSKVLRKLVVHKLLSSSKGHGGGFSLAMPASTIRYLDIFIAVGMQPELDRCVFGWGGCNTSHPCPLHESWSQFNESFLSWATKTTLADVTSLAEFSEVQRIRTER